MPAVAVVAVPARRLEGLAEVVEQEAATAVALLRVAAHHLDTRPVELTPVLLFDRGRLDLRRVPISPSAETSPLGRSSTAPTSSRRDSAVAELRLTQAGLLAQRPWIDRAVVREDGLRHALDLVGIDVPAAGEEAAEPEILGAVVEACLGRLAVASGAADLLVVGVERIARPRGGRRSGRSACRCPFRTRSWRR